MAKWIVDTRGRQAENDAAKLLRFSTAMPSPLALSFMAIEEPEHVYELSAVDDESAFRSVISDQSSGIVMVPEISGHKKQLSLKADAGDFAKWIRANQPDYRVELPKVDNLLVLRNSDCWLPLVYLATDITLPVYLNIVSSYLYDKLKGALVGETVRVHLSAMYEDKTAGVVKKFTFTGDRESLETAIKKFDVNEFMNDGKS